ncbi:MAG: hypothetical protein Q4D81_01910 [Eubacteriales bacterium]|nr:hypothetical protein [Eubacteriales bacterium]
MNTQRYEEQNPSAAKMRQVSLVRLLLLALRRWRSMVLAGLILAVLLAGLKVAREYKNRGVSNVAHEDYLAAMEIYNASVESYSTAIERFQTKIDAKQKYFNESLLMQIDPHNECAATVSMVVRTPGLEAADMPSSEPGETSGASSVNASNVTHAYTDFITSVVSYDEIAADLGVPEQSVRELVLISTDQYHFSSVFKVQARSMDMELSVRILDHILEELEKNRDNFRAMLGDYEISRIARSEETVVDTVLLQQQTELQNSIVTLQKNLQTSQTSLKELVRPTEATGASTKTIIKHGIKYGIVGMIGGFFLMGLLYAILILTGGRILSDDEISIAFGIPVLLTFPSPEEGSSFAGGSSGTGRRTRAGKKIPAAARTADSGRESRFPVDRLLRRLTSDRPRMRISDACDVLVAKVENSLAGSDSKTVVLAGSVGEARLASLAEALRTHAREAGSPVSFEPAADLERNAASIRRLHAADACILVEEIEESSYRAAAEQAEIALASGRPVLGTVYL